MHMSPRICCEMNQVIQSRFEARRRIIIYGGIFALVVAFPCPLQLPIGAISGSWKWIYIRGISIIIQLHVAEGSPQGKYEVV